MCDLVYRYTKCGMIFGSYLKHQMLRIEREIMKIRVMERRRKKKRRGGRDCVWKRKMLSILFWM